MMTLPYQMGRIAALTKLGSNALVRAGGEALARIAPEEGGTLGRAVLQQMGVGGGLGALTGGASGAIAAPEGEGLSGFGRGALAGGATGATLGGLAGGLTTRQAIKASPTTAANRVAGQTRMRSYTNPDAQHAADLIAAGRLGTTGAGLVGGGVAGVLASPEEKGLWEKIKARLGVG